MPRRFQGYGWHTEVVPDGNDLEAIDKALRAALAETERPSILCVRTVIGYGAPKKAGTHEAHGEPLGEDELRAAKQALGWPVEPAFLLPGAGAGPLPRGWPARRALASGVASAASTRGRRRTPSSRRNGATAGG